jgi:endo-1,4-beta-xylanase
MKSQMTSVKSLAGMLVVMQMAIAALATAADTNAALKDAFKSSFNIGVALNPRQFTEQDANAVALIKQQFNAISPENVMKWQLIHPRAGEDGYNFEPADQYVEFGEKNGMYIVGHTLVWHSQTPNWVFQGNNPQPAEGQTPGGRRGFGFSGPRASREELLERMRNHIHTVVGRYKGKVKTWDVVNEALADGGGEELLRNSLWRQIIGPDFIAKAFEYAQEADPDAILRYNDYSLENPAKRRKLITLVKSLQEQGIPVKAIGTQAHLNVSSASFESMDQALTEIETLGLPIHVTELDINSAQGGQRSTGADIANNAEATKGGLIDDANKRLADAYAGVFRAFLKRKDHVKLVTFWGANDAVSWRANGKPLLFDGSNRPKPAFEAVIAEAKKVPEAK